MTFPQVGVQNLLVPDGVVGVPSGGGFGSGGPLALGLRSAASGSTSGYSNNYASDRSFTNVNDYEFVEEFATPGKNYHAVTIFMSYRS